MYYLKRNKNEKVDFKKYFLCFKGLVNSIGSQC